MSKPSQIDLAEKVERIVNHAPDASRTYTLFAQDRRAAELEAGLYVVATPIGNLSDITLRALEILAGADLVACEDTRVTAKLLNRFGIRARTISYNEHNAEKQGTNLLDLINQGQSVALVSDAGTPVISDPGARLVRKARDAGVRVVPIPGASAPVTALVASGLASDAFVFAGFLPHKQGARLQLLQKWKTTPATLIFFESPNRLAKTINDLKTVFGAERQASVARELTKLHEEQVEGTIGELAAQFQDRQVKGEIVIIVGPPLETEGEQIDDAALISELLGEMSVSRAASEAAKISGKPKRELYALAQRLKDENG